jgi:DNA-binding response OmpR family regulator
MRFSIVYVDDSEVSLEAVKDGLAEFEFDVTTHKNPLTIYGVLSAVKPSLLLLDANMPTLDGKTICSLVKQHVPDLPIVIFSSLEAERLKAIVAQCGADGYIEKSGNFRRLAADIRRIIIRKNAGI